MRAIFRQRAHVARHIAAALLDLDLHFDLAGIGQIADQVIRIDDLDVVRQLDIAGHHGAGAILAQHQGHFVAVVQLEHHALEVQQDVDDIFANTGNGRIFVHHAGHLHFGRRVAGHRRQQDAAQGVAQRMAVAALERLHHDLGVMRPDRFDFDGTRLQKTLSGHVLFSFSIPSARYTDKADGIK
ncbi:Uncharacterised protein [Bordetella pertussis]|nr:Uncharacterised protein [Bordetella pertussis]CFO69332.1 Uncharacterised protein [Bordetella pertussis]CFP57109.1 Uncharacterised protein [Bordetella pertussis]CFU81467.1 Uncharacterised protein [Bordetella pertussis]CPH94067.1 Uncharacterised protein [Bordetella pertussis]